MPLLLSCGQTYYIVRHAEKAQPSSGTTMTTTNDPPLSSEGLQRAEALKETLANKGIRHIYSTNTIRTLSTVAPLSRHLNITPKLYSRIDEAFVAELKSLKNNALIVGHSNTIDDIVNRLSGQQHVAGDLPDSVYNHLYILKNRRGKLSFVSKRYGNQSSFR